RDMLCRLRYRALEFRLSRAGGAQSRVDARERRPRQWKRGAFAGGRSFQRRPPLPLAPSLPRAPSPAPQTNRLHPPPPPPPPLRPAQRAHQSGEAMNVLVNLGVALPPVLVVPV